MKYKIVVIEKHVGEIEVDANSLDEAISKAIENVVTDFDCVYDAFEVKS